MKLVDLVDELDLAVMAGAGHLGNDIAGGYASDLLSDVIANCQAGSIWVTLQIHVNIVAVASLKEMSGIVLINNRQPDDDTVKKAEAENIPILVSQLPAFELIGRLYGLGIRDLSAVSSSET